MRDKRDEIQWIDEIWKSWRGLCSTSEEQEWKIRFDAIRNRIEKGPEVDKAFIEKWINILCDYFDRKIDMTSEEIMSAMLHEAGMTVKGEK